MLGDVDQYVVPIVWINLFAQQMLSENQFRTTYVVQIGTGCWSKPTQHFYIRSLNICCVKTLQMLCKARLHNILAQHMLIALLIEHFLRVRPSEYPHQPPIRHLAPSPSLSPTISPRKGAVVIFQVWPPYDRDFWKRCAGPLAASGCQSREADVLEAFLISNTRRPDGNVTFAACRKADLKHFLHSQTNRSQIKSDTNTSRAQ